MAAGKDQVSSLAYGDCDQPPKGAQIKRACRWPHPSLMFSGVRLNL